MSVNVAATLVPPTSNANGSGVDVSTMGPAKTIIIGGTLVGIVTVEASLDGGTTYKPVAVFNGTGRKKVRVVCNYMRCSVAGYTSGTATCDVGGAPATNQLSALTVPAGNGAGASLDVSGYGTDWTVMVAGAFDGTIVVEVSQDDTDYDQVFPTFTTGGGLKSAQVEAKYVRIKRAGYSAVDAAVTAFIAAADPLSFSKFVTGQKVSNHKGIIPSARLNLATAPTNADTVIIEGHVFKFLTTLIAADTTTQVKIGTAAQSRARLIEAINKTADLTNLVVATTPHTLTYLADEIDTSRVRIQLAAAAGSSTLVTGDKTTSRAVSETLTAAADIWDRANLNVSGKSEDSNKVARGSIAITAAMIAAGKVFIELPFTPVDYGFSVYSATGLLLATDDLVTISASAIKIALAGGSAPNLVATNIVAFWACS